MTESQRWVSLDRLVAELDPPVSKRTAQRWLQRGELGEVIHLPDRTKTTCVRWSAAFQRHARWVRERHERTAR